MNKSSSSFASKDSNLLDNNKGDTDKSAASIHQERYASKVKGAALISTITALTLFSAKLAVWWLTGAVSLLAGLLDSLVDISASALNLLAIRFALQPADDDHSFGHGKAESLAALAQGMFVLGSALFLLLNGVQNIISPKPIENLSWGFGVILFSLIVTICLVLYQRYIYRLTKSQAIRADMLHYQSDIFMNSAILVALCLAAYGFIRADAVFALLIGVYISYQALKICYEAIQMLLDRALSVEEQEEIIAVAVNVDGVLGAHDLKTRQVGLTRFIQMHIEMSDDLKLFEAHAIADEVENALMERFPGSDILLHQDPESSVAIENRGKKSL